MPLTLLPSAGTNLQRLHTAAQNARQTIAAAAYRKYLGEP